MGPLYTTLRVLTAPSVEPVTVARAKQHLRVDSDDQDDLIATYVIAARAMVEQFLNRALITQTLQWVVAEHPGRTSPVWPGPLTFSYEGRQAFELPRPPVQSILSVSLLDAAENLTAAVSLKAALGAGATVLEFASVGLPSAVSTGTFAAELVGNAVPSGVTVTGPPTVLSGVASVTLSAPITADLAVGAEITFAAIAPRPLVSRPSPSPPPSLYHADLAFEPARVRLDWSVLQQIATFARPLRHLALDYIAGYGNDASAIPQPIIQAILILTAHLYERRGDEASELPSAIQWLLWPYRVVSFGG